MRVSLQQSFAMVNTLHRWYLITVLSVLCGCASIDFDHPKTTSTALPPEQTTDTNLGRMLEGLADAHPGQAGFFPNPLEEPRAHAPTQRRREQCERISVLVAVARNRGTEHDVGLGARALDPVLTGPGSFWLDNGLARFPTVPGAEEAIH